MTAKMAALRILVPVKRVIDYAVCLPFQSNDLFRVRAIAFLSRNGAGSWNESWKRGKKQRGELRKGSMIGMGGKRGDNGRGTVEK
jgi:hypothetical protein